MGRFRTRGGAEGGEGEQQVSLRLQGGRFEFEFKLRWEGENHTFAICLTCREESYEAANEAHHQKYLEQRTATLRSTYCASGRPRPTMNITRGCSFQHRRAGVVLPLHEAHAMQPQPFRVLLLGTNRCLPPGFLVMWPRRVTSFSSGSPAKATLAESYPCGCP